MAKPTPLVMAKDTGRPYDRSAFVQLALAEFPSLREEFAEDDGMLHLQMHALTRLIQRAKGAGEWATYKRGVHLATELWKNPDAELRNALNVSLLEHLDFEGERGPVAWACLPTDLQRAWQAMAAYNAALVTLGDRATRKRRR